MSRDANTLLVSLELILVNAGQVVFDDGEGEPVQLGLAFIFQPSNQIFWKSECPALKNVKTISVIYREELKFHRNAEKVAIFQF